jgi:hypothetical protein
MCIEPSYGPKGQNNSAQGLPELDKKTSLALTRRYSVAPSRKTPGAPGLEVLKGF